MGMFREENAKLNAEAQRFDGAYPKASVAEARSRLGLRDGPERVAVKRAMRGYVVDGMDGPPQQWAFEKITDLADFLIEHFEPGTIEAEVKEMMAGPLAKCDDPACPFCNEQPVERPGFRRELEQLINSYSMENGSNTPDYILAGYLVAQLRLFDRTVNRRGRWGAGVPGLGEQPANRASPWAPCDTEG